MCLMSMIGLGAMDGREDGDDDDDDDASAYVRMACKFSLDERVRRH